MRESRRGSGLPVGNGLGQPEVGHVGFAVGINQNIARLQIAVQDTMLMCVVYGPCNLGDQPGRGLRIAHEALDTRRKA